MDASNEIAVPARASVQRPAATILVCDDDRLVLVTLSAALRSAGYSVIEAENGDEAILLARQYRPDLAVLDIRMDGKSGLDVAAYLRDYVGTPFMFLSAFNDERIVRQAVEFGALAYLVKPFQRSELVPAVEVALGRFQEIKALHEATSNLEEQLETRKVVERAKGKLMDEHGMPEGDAFSFIQRTAMRERRTMKDIAQQVIDGSVVPPATSAS